MNLSPSLLGALRNVSAHLMKFAFFLVAMVFLFSPVQSTSFLLLVSLISLPYVKIEPGLFRSLKWILLTTILFLSWGAMGWIWAEYDQEIGERILKFLIGFPFIFILFNLNAAAIREKFDGFNWLFCGFVIAASVVIADFLTGYWLSQKLMIWKQGGFFQNILKPGSSLLLILGTALILIAFQRRSWKAGWLAILLIAAMLPHESVMHATRLILPMVVVIGLVCYWRPVLTAPLLGLLCALVLLILPLFLQADYFEPLAAAGVPFPHSMLHRLVIWDFASSLLDQHSWTGFGLGSSRYLGGDQVAHFTSLPGAFRENETWIGYSAAMDISLMPLHPHNLGLQIRLETGLVGVLLFLLFVMALIHRLSAACKGNEFAILAPVLVALILLGNFSFSIWQSWWLAAQALLAGMSLLLLKETRIIPRASQ